MAQDILEEITDNTRRELAILKEQVSLSDLEKRDLFKKDCRSLKDFLDQKDFGIIAEIKRKSPSAGAINLRINPIELAKTFQNGGASAISCLTDMKYFGGSVEDLEIVQNSVSIPVLRKEFIVDEFQIIEAKAYGADAILLIAEALTKQEAKSFSELAKSLGLSVLMEIHEEIELSKVPYSIDVLGVNNRNLKLQKTDIQTSVRLYELLPKEFTLITESGIKTKADIELLRNVGYQGALIGESIVGSENIEEKLKKLIKN